MTDDQIINVLVDENVVQEDADENVSDGPTCPKSGDVRYALDILRDYMHNTVTQLQQHSYNTVTTEKLFIKLLTKLVQWWKTRFQ